MKASAISKKMYNLHNKKHHSTKCSLSDTIKCFASHSKSFCLSSFKIDTLGVIKSLSRSNSLFTKLSRALRRFLVSKNYNAESSRMRRGTTANNFGCIVYELPTGGVTTGKAMQTWSATSFE